MVSLLPPTVTRLICFFLLVTPLLSLASPLADANAAPAPAPVANADAATPAKLQPRQAQPTRRMGMRKVKKSEPLKKKDYSSFLCPGGSVACPVYAGDEVTPESITTLDKSLGSLADWFKVGFECVELETELNSCGGCLALGAGQDCTAISNARATGCESSSCVVYSCFDGFVVSPDRSQCVKKGTITPATPITASRPESEQLVME